MRGKQAQTGSVIVFVALMLPFLILFAGMAIDIGRAYLYKSHMQNAADAAALAGITATGGQKARLITVKDVPATGTYIKTEATAKADAGANQILSLDTDGNWKNHGSIVSTELRKEIDPQKNSPLLKNRAVKYYYKVALSGAMEFQFAKLFLPEALLPADWTVNTEAWAAAENNPLSGIDLLTQLKETEDAYTFSTFQELDKSIKKPGAGYSTSERYQYVKDISFTNLGPAYNADGTRSEIFDMDGNNGLNNNMNSLLINFKPDFTSTKKLTDNWDLDKIKGMSVAKARTYLGDELGMQITNWRILDENGNPVTLPSNRKAESEGGTEWWGRFVDNYLTPAFGAEMARALMDARIASIINVTNPYKVRDLDTLSSSEISYDVYTDEPNELDPLFVRIESEEYNTPGGKGWVTNTVRDISINIEADNTVKSALTDEYLYRPMLFFYDGPVGEDEDGDGIGERGTSRKSRTVTLTLNKDFRGILFAPNSPVRVVGNNHKFYGIIVAERFVDENDETIEMPARQNTETDSVLQGFYSNMGLSDAQYDDFHAVRLNIYQNPQKDVFYLTDRANVTL